MQSKPWLWRRAGERNPTRRMLATAFLVLGLLLAGPGWAAGGHFGGKPALYEPASWWASLGQALEQGWAWLTGTSAVRPALGSGTAKADGTTNIDPNGRPQGQGPAAADGTTNIDPDGHP